LSIHCQSAASLAASASFKAYCKLGIDILITGVVGVTKDLAQEALSRPGVEIVLYSIRD
jgi:hypothetical protein